MELLALNQYINRTNIYALKSVLIFNLHSCIHNAHSLSHTHTHLYLAELGKHKWGMQSIGMRMWKSLSMKILSRSFTSLGLRMLSVCPLYRIVQKKETKGGREKHSRKQQLLFFFGRKIEQWDEFPFTFAFLLHSRINTHPHNKMKNFLLISILAVTVMAFLPRTTYGSTTTEVEEQPHALPVTAAEAQQNTAAEVWQEDDREVLIRSVRGAKNNNGANNGSGSGKKEKKKRVNNRKKSDEKIEKKTRKFNFLIFIFIYFSHFSIHFFLLAFVLRLFFCIWFSSVYL